ncbi:MAG: hypothetical protein K8E66_03620, partial [Phycisphaerales bacterium]|nr:hypothetical protein [Phycisphaerales bacterium]
MEPLFSESTNRRALARRLGAALVLVASLLILSPAAKADSTDFDFAQGLMDRGYFSLAQIEFQRMVDDPRLGATEKKEGELGLCLLRAKKALSVSAGYREGQDPSNVLAEFGASEAAFESFLSANPTHPRISDAIFEFCTMLQNKGSFLGQLVDEAKESGSRKLDQYTEETIRTFDKAIQYYDRVLAEVGHAKEGDPLYTRKTQARFYYSLAHYYKGRSLPVEHMSRIPALDRAVSTLEDFLWDHEDTVSGYYAFIYKGLAHGELGQYKDAIENLQNVLTSLNPADESDPRLKELVMNMICEAGLHLGRVCNKAKEAGGFNLQQIAADALEAHYAAVPASVNNRYGQLALLEAAKAMLGIFEFNKALKYAQDVSDAASRSGAAWGRGNKIRADRLIAEIFAVAPEGAIRPDPVLLWRAAEGKFSQGEY